MSSSHYDLWYEACETLEGAIQHFTGGTTLDRQEKELIGELADWMAHVVLSSSNDRAEYYEDYDDEK